MAAQWTVKVRGVNGVKCIVTVFSLTREEAKDEGLRVGAQYAQCECTVEHISCHVSHPRPFAKTKHGQQRRAERKFVRGETS